MKWLGVCLLAARVGALSPPATVTVRGTGGAVPILRRKASLKIAEDDAAPIELHCEKSGRVLECFPGAFIRLPGSESTVVIATPCDTPVAFAPSIDEDEDETWVIVQDDDPRMDAVFRTAARIVDEELDDCRMVRSALFPTLQGDLDDQFEEEDLDDDLEALEALDGEADFDEEVLSLVATFEVEELGHTYDMMRIEQVYQLLAKKSQDGKRWVILDEADADAVRPRIEEIIAEHDGDLADEIKINQA